MEDPNHLPALNSRQIIFLTSSGAPRGGRRECLVAPTTVRKTATGYDQRPAGRFTGAGRCLLNEWDIVAANTKHLIIVDEHITTPPRGLDV